MIEPDFMQSLIHSQEALHEYKSKAHVSDFTRVSNCYAK